MSGYATSAGRLELLRAAEDQARRVWERARAAERVARERADEAGDELMRAWQAVDDLELELALQRRPDAELAELVAELAGRVPAGRVDEALRRRRA